MKKLFALMLGLLSCTLLLCLSVNAVELYVDTELVQTDVPPQLVGGRTLVPMRAIFEYLGAEVTWDNDTRTATGTLDDTVVIIQIDQYDRLRQRCAVHAGCACADHRKPDNGSGALRFGIAWLRRHMVQ